MDFRISRKRRIILIFAVAMMCSLFLFVGVGCGQKGNDSSSGTTDSGLYDPSKEGNKQSLSIDPVKVIELGEEVVLNVKSSNIESELYWRSSNENVATVTENGKVTSRNVGETVITVYGGSLSADCRLTVTKTSVAPVINLDTNEVVMNVGSSYNVNVTSVRVGDKTVNAGSFVWNGNDGSDAGIISFKANNDGSRITITADKAGETELYVSCSYYNNIGVSKVNVKVVDLTVIDITGLNYTGDGVYEATGYTTEYDKLGYNYSVITPFELAIYKNGKKIDATPEFTVADTDIARIENNNKIVGLREGSTTITCTYGGVTKIVKYSCKRPTVELKAQTEGAVDLYVSDTFTVDQASAITENIEKVYFARKGNEFSEIGSYANGKITIRQNISSAIIGDGTFKLSSENIDFVFDGSIYTMVIDSAEKLNRLNRVSKAQSAEMDIYDGYYVLAADIDLPADYVFDEVASGVTPDGNNGFIGVFDGKAHKINGLNIKNGGMFAVTGENSVIKNVIFTEASVTDSGFISSGGAGTVKNLYIEYKKITVSKNYGKNVGTVFVNGIYGAASVSNCVIYSHIAEYNSADKTYAKLFLLGGTNSSDSVYENVLLTFKTSVQNKAVTSLNGKAYKNANDNYISSTSQEELGEKLTGFEKKWDIDFWELDDNGCPKPVTI